MLPLLSVMVSAESHRSRALLDCPAATFTEVRYSFTSPLAEELHGIRIIQPRSRHTDMTMTMSCHACSRGLAHGKSHSWTDGDGVLLWGKRDRLWISWEWPLDRQYGSAIKSLTASTGS